jgi:hypothetical protein
VELMLESSPVTTATFLELIEKYPQIAPILLP